MDWNDDNGAVGPLSRKSFRLHKELSQELAEEIDYRELNTLSIRAKKIAKGKKVNLHKKEETNLGSFPPWLNGEEVLIFGTSNIGNQQTTAQVLLL